MNQMIYLSSRLLERRNPRRVRFSAPEGSLERFVWRAIRNGIAITSRKLESARHVELWQAVACLIAIVVVVASLRMSVFVYPSLPLPTAYSTAQAIPDLKGGNTNSTEPSRSNSLRGSSAGRAARHRAVKFPQFQQHLPEAGPNSDSVLKIEFEPAQGTGSLAQRFRSSNLMPAIRPVSFHLSLGDDLSRPANTDVNSSSCQRSFCFNPQWVFLASYDSPHIPVFDWTVPGEIHGIRNSLPAPPSAP